MKHSDSANTVVFRYSSRFIYYLLLYGIWLSTTILSFYVIHKYLYSPFYGDNYVSNRNYSDLISLSIFICIISAAICGPILGMLVALHLTDKYASVTLFDDYLLLSKNKKDSIIQYREIEYIRFLNICTSSKGYVFSEQGSEFMDVKKRNLAPSGPYVYRITIFTKDGRLNLQGSYLESWETRKSNTFHSIYKLCEKLTDCGLKVKYYQTIL